ncbi:MAG: hypothetical protein M3R27_02915 [Bacteroidota bacterium]|nr:hypothetical protein [Bacteroidota bacterium]
MINPTRYQTLYKCDKARLLRTKGEFIDSIEAIGFRTSLYILDGFYVEVFYSYSNKQIEQITVLNDVEKLEMYTKKIRLNNLW